jgi:hypothetical protein
MQNIHCILETEAIFSDDNQHRYLELIESLNLIFWFLQNLDNKL